MWLTRLPLRPWKDASILAKLDACFLHCTVMFKTRSGRRNCNTLMAVGGPLHTPLDAKPRSPGRPSSPGLRFRRYQSGPHQRVLPILHSHPWPLAVGELDGLMWNYAVASTFESRRRTPSAPTTQSALEPGPPPREPGFPLREDWSTPWPLAVGGLSQRHYAEVSIRMLGVKLRS